MAASGVPLRKIQEWLGHADSKTTQIYTHYAPDAHEVQMVNDGFAAGADAGDGGVPEPDGIPLAEPAADSDLGDIAS